MRQREVLCIDDDDQSLAVRKILLETFDFRVNTATSGREGLKLLRSRKVDAVVVDYQMPEMDGGEVARAVKGLRPKTPVLVLSALPLLPQEAPRECIDAFLTKGGPTCRLVHEIEHMIAAVPEPAKERTCAARMIGAVSGMVVEKVRGLLGKSEARPRPKLARVPARSN
ncbi:MAG: response regulator [Acidobacteriia bacterium]|nr:response regulator [Terriglobia bacterium]